MYKFVRACKSKGKLCNNLLIKLELYNCIDTELLILEKMPFLPMVFHAYRHTDTENDLV